MTDELFFKLHVQFADNLRINYFVRGNLSMFVYIADVLAPRTGSRLGQLPGWLAP